MRSNKLLCDRCEKEINGGPYITITVDYHPPKKLDICYNCEVEFTLWLGKHPLSGTTLQEMMVGRFEGTGYPSKKRLEQLSGEETMTKDQVRALASQCNCHFHIPEASPCPIHNL